MNVNVKHYYRFKDFHFDDDDSCDISEPYFEGENGIKVNGCTKHFQCIGHRTCNQVYQQCLGESMCNIDKKDPKILRSQYQHNPNRFVSRVDIMMNDDLNAITGV